MPLRLSLLDALNLETERLILEGRHRTGSGSPLESDDASCGILPSRDAMRMRHASLFTWRRVCHWACRQRADSSVKSGRRATGVVVSIIITWKCELHAGMIYDVGARTRHEARHFSIGLSPPPPPPPPPPWLPAAWFFIPLTCSAYAYAICSALPAPWPALVARGWTIGICTTKRSDEAFAETARTPCLTFGFGWPRPSTF